MGYRDVRDVDAIECHDRATAHEKIELGHRSFSFASASTNRSRTSIAATTSLVATDSAGWWLMPPTQRTKSIPTGTISDITTASCPAPEGSRSTGNPAA